VVSRSDQRKDRRHRKFFSDLEIALCEAISVHVRYETPDEDGKTRRERNEQFNTASPEFIIPEGGEYLWSWYFEVSDGVRRVDDGVCFPIPWSEFLAWKTALDRVVSADEYAILRAMDAAFCEETNNELRAYHERRAEAQRLEMEAAARQR
jgi:hypothetical protein